MALCIFASICRLVHHMLSEIARNINYACKQISNNQYENGHLPFSRFCRLRFAGKGWFDN
jgi:hypothetical protein